jgi:hypothetical protein
MRFRANPYGDGNPYSTNAPDLGAPDDAHPGMPDDALDGQGRSAPRQQPNGAPAPGSSSNQPYGVAPHMATSTVPVVCRTCGTRGPVKLSVIAKITDDNALLCRCGSADVELDDHVANAMEGYDLEQPGEPEVASGMGDPSQPGQPEQNPYMAVRRALHRRAARRATAGAFEQGERAFWDGKPRIPDIAPPADSAVGSDTSKDWGEQVKQWLAGWDRGNLSAPLDFGEGREARRRRAFNDPQMGRVEEPPQDEIMKRVETIPGPFARRPRPTTTTPSVGTTPPVEGFEPGTYVGNLRHQAVEWVTTGEWGVSYVGYAPNVTLNVHKSVDEPNEWGGIGKSVRHPEHDGKVFPTVEAAQQYAADNGLLQRFRDTDAGKSYYEDRAQRQGTRRQADAFVKLQAPDTIVGFANILNWYIEQTRQQGAVAAGIYKYYACAMGINRATVRGSGQLDQAIRSMSAPQLNALVERCARGIYSGAIGGEAEGFVEQYIYSISDELIRLAYEDGRLGGNSNTGQTQMYFSKRRTATSKWYVEQRGGGSAPAAGPFDTKDEAQAAADQLNETYGFTGNNYVPAQQDREAYNSAISESYMAVDAVARRLTRAQKREARKIRAELLREGKMHFAEATRIATLRVASSR